MDIENFETYTTDDFILDEEFREIIHNGDTDALKFLKENLPGKKEEIELACVIVENMRAPVFKQDMKRKQKHWNQIVSKKSRQRRFQFLKYAATFLLIASVGSSLYYFNNLKSTESANNQSTITSNNAVLVLTDGTSVSIDSKQSKIQYSEDGSGIMVNDTSGIAQTTKQKGFNQLIVPFGKRSFITLSEGTKVWLNSGSKLIFPPVFRGNTREVTLEGEGFFDVSHSSTKPFYVKTDAFSVRVFGTKFNVQAYQNEIMRNVVLVEGKVGLRSLSSPDAPRIILAPSQKAEISGKNEKFDISTIENTEVYTAWVDGYLTFTDEEVSVVLKRVSRYYNVIIETNLPAHIEKIYGKLDLKDDLNRVLDGIAFISKTKYKKEGNKILFYE